MPRTMPPVLTARERNAAVRRVARLFRQTTPDQRAAGMGWYRTAWQAARAIAGDDGAAMAAGVIAALSPRCQWSTNVAWASAVIHAARTGQGVPRVHTTVMRDQAWRIANGEAPLDVLRGPKVRAFYANIVGDPDAVTVDVWAVRAARGDRPTVPDGRGRLRYADDGTVTAAEYAAYADVYRRAARACGVTPRECQAAVWVAVRGVKPTDAGFHADAAREAA